MSEVLKEGEEVMVKVLEIDKQGARQAQPSRSPPRGQGARRTCTGGCLHLGSRWYPLGLESPTLYPSSVRVYGRRVDLLA